jgi:hypothetical protein
MNSTMNEKLQWFQILTSLCEIATPHIITFTGIKCQALEKQDIDMEPIGQSSHVLKKLSTLIVNLPEPHGAELKQTKKQMETVLSNCVTGLETVTKYVQLDRSSTEYQVQLDKLINSLALAREYIDSTYKRLNILTEHTEN